MVRWRWSHIHNFLVAFSHLSLSCLRNVAEMCIIESRKPKCVHLRVCMWVGRRMLFCTHMCANIHRFATHSLHSFAFCTHTNEHWTADEDEYEKNWTTERKKKKLLPAFVSVYSLCCHTAQPLHRTCPTYSNILKKRHTQNSSYLSLTNSFAIGNTPNAKYCIRKVKLRQVHAVGLLHKIYSILFGSFAKFSL